MSDTPINAATRHALKITRAVHKIANAEITINGNVYPCHHNIFDTTSPLYGEGRAKTINLSAAVVVPLFGPDNKPYDIDGFVKAGVNIFEVRSVVRRSLTHQVRVEHFQMDEACYTLFVTDTRR